jgi:delta 1-pyrroline-5-carboxylate dehydrogenase
VSLYWRHRDGAGHRAIPCRAARSDFPFIAETGGINTMIVDSSALAEQVVTDVLTSAFGSAGQRCSALRLLCLQDDIADRVLRMLQGAAETLLIGDPLDPATDVGPVIDEDARAALERAVARSARRHRQFCHRHRSMAFFAPRLSAGSCGCARRGDARSCCASCAPCREAGRGDGLDRRRRHARLAFTAARGDATAHCGRLRIGTYVNRNQIGAVVACSRSADAGFRTRPKAGGSITLYRFPKRVCLQPAAAGGNAARLPRMKVAQSRNGVSRARRRRDARSRMRSGAIVAAGAAPASCGQQRHRSPPRQPAPRPCTTPGPFATCCVVVAAFPRRARHAPARCRAE